MGASPLVPEASSLPERIGQYTILCQLDQGGMATLFLGRAAGLGGFERLFAIKLIHEHLSREKRFVDMFLDEARLAARIVHPNVVSVYEVGLDKGRHFIAMDYINGETLSLALQHTWGQHRPFPVGLAAYLIGQAAEGLHAAHELRGTDGKPLGVVHRDVAPSNLMLGYDGILRVMDFGVAKARDQVTHTRPGTIKGTLAYMAPEHVRSRTLDRRADVWSLGVVLWETLVGKRLFKGRNDVETSDRLLRRRILNPTQLQPELSPALDDIVSRALQRDPEKRFASAREMGEALQEYLATARLRIGPSDVEAFMKSTFEERFAWREEIQQRAPTATAKEFKVYEGLIEDPASDADLEIDLLAEDAMEEIVAGTDDVDGTPEPIEAAAPVPEKPAEPELVSAPVVGLTQAEVEAKSTEPTLIVRSERALAKARQGRAEKVSDGRIFLFQWRERAEPSVELMLEQARDPKMGLYVGLGTLALLVIVGTLAWSSLRKDEPKFETISPASAGTPAEATPPAGAAVSPPEEPVAKAEATSPEPAAAPSPAPADPAASVFELRFDLEPKEAQLTVDGRPQDSAERLTGEVGRSFLVEAQAPGYRSYRKVVKLRQDQTLRIELERSEAESARPKSPRKPRTDGPKKKDKLLIIDGDDL